jgi:hypothetical protein
LKPALHAVGSLTKYFSVAEISCLLKISPTNDSISALFVEKVI